MLTAAVITRRAQEDGVDAKVVERDYVLAHIAAQLPVARPADGGQMVFKGGTSLRLVHLRDYRYSADLDFTVREGSSEAAIEAMREVLDAAKAHAGLPLLELSEKGKQGIIYVGPLGAQRPRPIKLDIADYEYVENVVQGVILPGIWNDLPESLPFGVYSIEEIGAEKLRCIIQRVECRDLYDLYRLTADGRIMLAEIRPLFEEKARRRDIDPALFAERFEDRIDRCSALWDAEMPEHLPEPPHFEEVERVVRRHLREADLLE
jgi:uncharacterized protein